jgi:hypothetical protein
MPIQNKIPTTLKGSVHEIHKIWQTCWIKDNSLSIKLAGRGSMLHTADLWEWAIASHGRVLVPLGWLQVIFPGHGFKCW